MENKKFTCPICNETFDTEQEYALHHANKHPNEPLGDEDNTNDGSSYNNHITQTSEENKAM